MFVTTKQDIIYIFGCLKFKIIKSMHIYLPKYYILILIIKLMKKNAENS